MATYEIPSVEDLIRLAEPHPGAVTIYLCAAPTPQGHDAVRPGEVEAGIWNGRLLAGLRHPLA